MLHVQKQDVKGKQQLWRRNKGYDLAREGFRWWVPQWDAPSKSELQYHRLKKGISMFAVQIDWSLMRLPASLWKVELQNTVENRASEEAFCGTDFLS